MSTAMRLYMRLNNLTHYWRRIRQVREFGIGATDLVLDVGSGQDPHPRANILCDKYVADSTERSMRAPIAIDRTLVVSDAARTPFADKTFDFVFCSHLLEHVEDPAVVLAELQRIGRAGYIETPSKVYEKLWGWEFHRWFVDIRDGELVFEPKASRIFDSDLHDWFERGVRGASFWRLFIPRVGRLGLLTRYVWRDEIKFSISDPGVGSTRFARAAVAHNESGLAGSEPRATTSQRAKTTIGRRLRRRSDARIDSALRAMQCVQCPGTLTRGVSDWRCSGCGRAYSVKGDVHFFLSDSNALVGVDPASNAGPRQT